MTCFSGAKINIGLHITGKRENDYHNLSTVFYPLPFPMSDIVEIVESKDFKFTQAGLTLDIASEQNLCVKAYDIMKKNYPNIPPVHIYLYKVVPYGAGLAGGSANATYIVKMLNEMFHLGISFEELLIIVKKLGSDCPFFLDDSVPCLAEGTGDKLIPIPEFNLKNNYLTLILPSFSLSTAQVFSSLQINEMSLEPISIKTILDKKQWSKGLKNNLEIVAFDIYPELKTIKDNLYADGAFYSSMSGSGSSIYGIFKKKPLLSQWSKKYNCLTFQLNV